MKRLNLTLLVIVLTLFKSGIYAQDELKLFISDSLEIRNLLGDLYEDPFTGGIESPKFFNMDLNNDAKQDLVVFDRANGKISTYINIGTTTQSKFTYSPEFESFFPKGRYNYVIADVDRDGFKDVICGDLNQNKMSFYRNKGLQLPLIRFQFQSYLAYVHYQPPVPDYKNNFGNPIQHIHGIDDIDGDGDLDFVTLSPLGGNLEFYKNNQVEKGLPADSLDFYLGELCFGYFNEGNTNSILLHQCQGPKYYTRRHAGGTSVFFIDLNGDGDKDLLLGNNSYDNLLMLENGYEDYTANYDTIVSWDNIFPRNTTQAKINTFPMVSYCDITGNGKNDMIVTPTWNADYNIKNINQTLLYENTGANDNPIFTYKNDNFLMEKSIDFGNYTSPAFYDFDSDGDQDLFVAYSGNSEITGFTKDKVAVYENIGTKNKANFKLILLDFSNLSAQNLTYSRLSIFDFDKDGRPEFYFGQQDGSIKSFKFVGDPKSTPLTLSNNNFGNVNAVYGYAAPAFWDFDNDGNNDLLLGANSGKIQYFKNTGTNAAPIFTLVSDTIGKMMTNELRTNTNPPSYSFFGRSTPIVVDMNGDGKNEIISGSNSGQLYAWKPTADAFDSFIQFPKFLNFVNSIKNDTTHTFNFGLNTTVAAADLDGDTIADLLVGNDAGGFHFLSGKARVAKITVGIQKVTQKDFNIKVYPNPTTSNFTVANLPEKGEKTIQVYDVLGKEILHRSTNENNINLDLSENTKGIYMIKIEAKG